MFYANFILIITLLSFSVESANLPSYIKPCRTSDPNWTDCAKKHAADAIPSIIKGDKKYGIPVLNPLLIESISIDPTSDLNIKISNLTVTGLDTAELLDAKNDEKELQFLIGLKYLQLTGNYNVDGRLLQIPIRGNGPMTLKTTNTNFRVVYPWKFYTKDGEEYLDIKDAYPVLKHEKIEIHLENLFNGDKDLGERTNTLINENWRALNDEINPAIVAVIRKLCTKIVGGITKRVPVKDIFPK